MVLCFSPCLLMRSCVMTRAERNNSKCVCRARLCHSITIKVITLRNTVRFTDHETTVLVFTPDLAGCGMNVDTLEPHSTLYIFTGD